MNYNIKYLGLTIRDDWSVRDHLEKVAIKVEITINKLGRLMATKKGPSEKKRKLYKNITNSIILYGAAVWAKELNERPNISKKIHALQRKILLRVIRAYRTVSQDIALVLARNPSVEIQAAKMEAVYTKNKVAVEGNVRITDRISNN